MRLTPRYRITLLACVALPLAAQTIPATINYQGRLTDNSPSQAPVNASVPMAFAIYDAATLGTKLWSEPATGGISVPISNGIFSVALGSSVTIPPTVFTGATSARYLEITLNPGAVNQEILSPRQLVSATGYANLAQNANNAVSATTATNSAQLGGVAASGYLTTSGTAFDSARLGGTLASGWQMALTPASCPANQFFTGITQAGAATCAAAPGFTEVDPKVGTLTTGRIPRWNATSLADGTLFDTGAAVGLRTTTPAAPLHVAPGTPVLAGGIQLGSVARPASVFVQGRYAYVADRNSQLAVIDVSVPGSPVTVSTLSLPSANPNAIFVQGRHAYLTYQATSQFQVIDISNPKSPVALGAPTPTTTTGPGSIYAQGRYVYIACYGGGASALRIFDVTNPSLPSAAGSVALTNAASTVWVQGRYAYLTGSGGRLIIVDVANPAAPSQIASSGFLMVGASGLAVQGRYAYVSAQTTFNVVDVSNPASPALAASAPLPSSSANALAIQGRYAVIAGDTSNYLSIFDVSAPAAPVQVATATTGNGPWSVFVQGRHAYLAEFYSSRLEAYDLGGALVQQLEAGGIETGTLAARGNAQVGGDAQVAGGLAVGAGGVYSQGPIASPLWRTTNALPYGGAALPRTSAAFTTSGGTLMITASASGFSTSVNATLTVNVQLDAGTVATLNFFTNEASSHKPLVPATVFVSGVAPGSHTVALSAGAGTLTDFNDYSQVTVIELPF